MSPTDLTAAIEALRYAREFIFGDEGSTEECRRRIEAALAALERAWKQEGDWQLVPKEPTDVMVNKALSSTAVWHDIPGSRLTVNREKMRIRWRAMLAAVPLPAHSQEGWQTIDKAPTDGTFVLTTDGKNRHIESFPTVPEDERLWAWVSDAPWRPTHFMELPPLPAPPPAEGDG